MKKYLFFAAAIALMASCADDNIVGEGNEYPVNGELRPITFGSYTAATTRADKTGSDAAALLGNNFVVYGFKGNGTTQEKVFDHYNVNWVDNTANTTTSNTSDWEYVAQTKHAHATIAAQTIKYWDYATTQYDFIAWSKGTATAVYAAGDYDKDANILITATTPTTMTSATGGAYTIKGKAANLAKVYIADLVTAYREPVATGDYQKEVEIKFRSLSAKVRIALYETVPGYSVKDVVFYSDDDTPVAPTSPETWGTAHLYTKGSDVFNEEGTYTVYYPTTGSANKLATDYNKAHVVFVPETSGTATVKDFGAIDADTKVVREVAETASTTDKLYIGRESNHATYFGPTASDAHHYTVVIPNETGAALHLKVNYTLVSTDGSGEVIHVTGATAVVPAEYGTWKSGYAYTYIFKISQNTNGVTNPAAGPAGLYPITFDAVVMDSEADGIQETITTVAEPSITTYAKGAVVTANDEYTAGKTIYVVVNKGGSNVNLETTTGTINAKLYTVTLEDTDNTDAITEAAQTINEASIANALAQGGTVTDANKFKMTVTADTGLSNAAQIAAADAPDGNAVTINGAKFTGVASTTYVFEFIDTADSDKKYYKIIKVQ